MAREVELKFKINDKKSFLNKLKDKGIVMSNSKKQFDKIYMLKGKDFKDLKRGETVIRIRKENGNLTTTIKKYVDGIKDRQEVECSITDVDSFAEFLELLDFRLLVEVVKERCIGHFLGANITLDSVYKLGDFSEIEIVSKENDVSMARKQVEEIANILGLDSSNLVELPYDEMIFMKGRQDND